MVESIFGRCRGGWWGWGWGRGISVVASHVKSNMIEHSIFDVCFFDQCIFLLGFGGWVTHGFCFAPTGFAVQVVRLQVEVLSLSLVQFPRRQITVSVNGSKESNDPTRVLWSSAASSDGAVVIHNLLMRFRRQDQTSARPDETARSEGGGDVGDVGRSARWRHRAAEANRGDDGYNEPRGGNNTRWIWKRWWLLKRNPHPGAGKHAIVPIIPTPIIRIDTGWGIQVGSCYEIPETGDLDLMRIVDDWLW